ncbi:CDP-alcohol phosphatidyltransferase family protein [Candidatus Phytoplasma fraxini]|uniref:CDP-diacylglycerol--serine O-phosphatidyltransferase n=1 Tax=Ash yellows phytoplasma TaxID=35780 RepID=A0ABZ2U865_ASHYP
MFLGFYNYTVYLTYLNALSGFIGMYFIMIDKNPEYISICMLISGICDIFDGFISNFKKKRSIEETKYGIQIDSLADIISFGILPLLMGFALLKNLENPSEILCFLFVCGSILYILAVVIRLAYFNVLAENNLNCPYLKEKTKIFIGVPVTSASIVFPFLILSQNIFCCFFDKTAVKLLFCQIYLFFIILLSFLFIFDKVKLKKPQKKVFLIFFIIIFLLLICFLLILRKII